MNYPSGNDPINQITKVRLANGQEVAIVDWQWRPLYSTVDMLSGMSDLELPAFNYSEGDQVSASANVPNAARRTATLRDTNASQASEMPSEEEYLVYGLAVELYQLDLSNGSYVYSTAGAPMPNAPNVALLHERIILELEVSQKAYNQASLGWFAAGFGPSAAVVGPAAAAVRSYATNGAPSRDAIDRSPMPVHIGGTEKFRVIFNNPGGAAIDFVSDAGAPVSTTIMRARVNFIGLHKRPAA